MGITTLFARSHSSKSQSPPPSPSLAPSPSFLRRLGNHPDDLRRVFDKFDADGDGRISLPELSRVLLSLGGAPEDAAAMMREADADGDGFISLDEFVAVNRTGDGDGDGLDDLRRAFTVYDRDGNGVISAEELHHVLRSMGEKTTLAACKGMIRGVDRNGDGAVNFEEFLLMMGRPSSPQYA